MALNGWSIYIFSQNLLYFSSEYSFITLPDLIIQLCNQRFFRFKNIKPLNQTPHVVDNQTFTVQDF